MSRYYRMVVEVRDFKPQRLDAIKAAANQEWEFADWTAWSGNSVLEGMGESFLTGGEGEEEFRDRLAQAVWTANQGYCPVALTATFLEAPPTTVHVLTPADYQRLVGNQSTAGEEATTHEQEAAPA